MLNIYLPLLIIVAIILPPAAIAPILLDKFSDASKKNIFTKICVLISYWMLISAVAALLFTFLDRPYRFWKRYSELYIFITFVSPFFLSAYLLPSLIAHFRNSKYKKLVYVVNVLTGWVLGIGWLVALVFSLLPEEKKTESNPANNQPPNPV